MVLALIASGITYAITTALSAIGFTAVGPAAGSIAAWAQAVVYGGAIPAGGLFAILQSIGMGGALGAQHAGVVVGGLSLAALSVAIFAATYPFLAPVLSANVYRLWIYDTLTGATQTSLRELLCSAGGICSRLTAKL